MRKSLKIAVALPLVAALLGLGAAPARADGVELPPNGNGTDNSGIHVEICPDSMHMKLPVTPSADENDSPIASMYHYMEWTVEVDGYNSFVGSISWDSGFWGNSMSQVWTADLTNGTNGAEPGDVLDVTLSAKSIDSLGNVSSPSNPISMQVTVLDPTGFASGSGTKADPYIVTNAEELNLIRCTENKHFELGNSIDLNNEPWLPIRGGDSKDESGTHDVQRLFLDGNGFSISNLYVDLQRRNAGLFGKIENSLIKDLVLESPEIWGGFYVGSLAGDVRHSQFLNIKVIDTDIHGFWNKVGGLIGHYDYRGVFRNLEVDGQITGEDFYYSYEWAPGWLASTTYHPNEYGGLIGYDDGDGSSHENNTTNVDITIGSNYYVEPNFDNAESSVSRVGGYIGEAGQNVMIKNVKSTSNIELDATRVDKVGGLTGDSEESLFSDIESTSTITVHGQRVSYLGGLIGDSYHTAFDAIKSTTAINVYSTDYASRIGGMIGDSEYGGLSDLEITSDINLIATDDQYENDANFASKIGGVVGYLDSGEIQNVRSSSTIEVALADGTNNPENIDIAGQTDQSVEKVGGIIGEHDDYSSYLDIESSTAISIGDFTAVTDIGGGFGDLSDSYTPSFNHLVVKGTVTPPSYARYVGGLIGHTDGSWIAVNTLVAVNVAEHVDMVDVGPIIGGYESTLQDREDYIERTFTPETYWDSTVETMANNFDNIGSAATTADMSNAEWLATNKFDTTRFWKVEGSYPTLRLTLGTPVASFVKFGQANKKLTLVFSPVKKGKRTFKINLASTHASKKIKLVVVRGGVKVKTIKAGTLDLLGDRTFKTKVRLKKADKLQIKIGKKIVARHLVR